MARFEQLSEEQKQPFHFLMNGSNVITTACAGAGKTTTVLATVAEMSRRRQQHQPDEMVAVMITFNNHLRKEVMEKADVLGILHTNIHVHTFHSYASRYYLSSTFDDISLNKICEEDLAPRTSLPKIFLWILDECQDMNVLYYRFIQKCLRDSCLSGRHQLWCLGDERQTVYAFKGSDARFLTLADQLQYPGLVNEHFHRTEMLTSFRITPAIAEFVNKEMLGKHSFLRSAKAVVNHIPVSYTIVDKYNTLFKINKNFVERQICELVHRQNVSPDSIFVLAPSLKSIEIKEIANALTKNNIPIYFKTEERKGGTGGGGSSSSSINDNSSDSIMAMYRNKVVFSTFSSCKGLERDYVFVLGFNPLYYNMFEEDANGKGECPNAFYVAATRAKKQLILVDSLKMMVRSARTNEQSQHQQQFVYEQQCVPFKFLRSPVSTFVKDPSKAWYVDVPAYQDVNMVNKQVEDMKAKHRICELRDNAAEIVAEAYQPLSVYQFNKMLRPSEMIRFLSSECCVKVDKLLSQIFFPVGGSAETAALEGAMEELVLPDKVQTMFCELTLEENVAELNGLFIPEWFFASCYGITSISKDVQVFPWKKEEWTTRKRAREEEPQCQQHEPAGEANNAVVPRHVEKMRQSVSTLPENHALRQMASNISSALNCNEPSTFLQHLLVNQVYGGGISSSGGFNTDKSLDIHLLMQLQNNFHWLDEEKPRLVEIYKRMEKVLGGSEVKNIELRKQIFLNCYRSKEDGEISTKNKNIDGQRQTFSVVQKVHEYLKGVHVLGDTLKFEGELDVVFHDKREVYELKNSSKLSIEHKLQLAIYAWIANVAHEQQQQQQQSQEQADHQMMKFPYDYRLYNIRTGELLYLDANVEQLNEIVTLVMNDKLTKNKVCDLSDEEFVQFVRAASAAAAAAANI